MVTPQAKDAFAGDPGVQEKIKEIEGKSAVDEFMSETKETEVSPEKPAQKKWQNPKKKGKK